MTLYIINWMQVVMFQNGQYSIQNMNIQVFRNIWLIIQKYRKNFPLCNIPFIFGKRNYSHQLVKTASSILLNTYSVCRLLSWHTDPKIRIFCGNTKYFSEIFWKIIPTKGSFIVNENLAGRDVNRYLNILIYILESQTWICFSTEQY